MHLVLFSKKSVLCQIQPAQHISRRMMAIVSILLSFLIGTPLHAQQSDALLPMPNHVVTLTGEPLRLHNHPATLSISDTSLTFAVTELQTILREEMHLNLVTTNQSEATVQLRIDPTLHTPSHPTSSQRYQLEVDAQHLLIRGATPQAVFYGIQTLHQLLLGDRCTTARNEINPIRIDDAPRFAYRALMLDPARHFLPIRDVKFYIDQMVRYKYNVLQLHLTDDQGWRVEIKSHPELASKDHYTQAELHDLIAYAAQRHVEIVPEMDIPGHTVAILAAHPELGCTTSDTIAKEVGKTVNLMLCASVDKVYTIYQDIFSEMGTLFPSKYIHLGGDESVIEKNWAQCTRCQRQMKERGYTQARQLMIPFFDRMLDMVDRAGKTPILWCELDKVYPPANEYLFPYPKNVTLVTWRNGLTPKCIELTHTHGHPLIMAPGEYTYFDYPQLKGDLPEFNNWGMPVTTLEQAYAFDPGYGLPAASQAHIQGVMGTLWGEAMPDINRVTYMTYPRALALAEAGWTQLEHRSWDSFKHRLYPNLYFLMKAGVSVRVPFEIVDRK